MATGLRYERLANGKIRRTFERSTGETVRVDAPFYYFEDFMAPTSTSAAAVQYVETETNAGTVTFPENATGAYGTAVMLAPADVSDDVAILSSELETFQVTGGTTTTKNFQFETRCKIVFNTGSSFAGKQAFVGFIDGTIPTVTGTTTFTNAAACVGFTFGEAVDGQATTDVQTISATTDDTTNRNDVDIASDFVDDTWMVLRFDATDPEDVKFYKDGVRVASSTTFDISNLTEAEAGQQIVLGALSHSTDGDSASISLVVDYVKIWSTR